MSRLNSLLIATLMVVGIATINIGIAQAAFLKIDIAAPDNSINSRTFNVEYTALSTDESANINVSLFQDGSVIRTATTTEPYGDSGSFEITVPKDGTYSYQFKAVNGADNASSPVKTVKVDTAPAEAPAYGGAVRDGNTYTVTFTAPANTDVTQIRIYSSPNPNFTADESTQVAVVDIKPGQKVTVSYTSPDDRQRYTAIQAFDGAGNGSGLVGDANTNVRQGLGNPGQPLPNAVAQNGVAGAETENNDGQVNADGDSTDENKRSVQGESQENSEQKSDDTSDNGSWIAWAIVVALILGTIAYANKDKISELIKRKK